jgi:predicted  nucleic acid-binding Zn-ribbon protein
MSYQIICKDCKCIIIEDIEEDKLKELGKFIECPTCGRILNNPAL